MQRRCLSALAGLSLVLSAVSGLAEPNLIALSVESSAFGGDCDSLDVLGSLDVWVENADIDDVIRPFDVSAFVDVDGDGFYSAMADRLLGVTTVSPPLASGSGLSVSVDVAGELQFRDGLIHVWVDSGETELESDETDNIIHSGMACQRPPVSANFELIVEWEWLDDAVASAPLVGDVNADGSPDVVFASISNQIVCLDGRTGAEHWRTTDMTWLPAGSSTPALGELDGDPGLEIISLSGDQLAMWDDDGSLVWRSDSLSTPITVPTGAVTLADLNCDGSAEAIFQSGVIQTSDGMPYWIPAAGSGTVGSNSGYAGISTAADVDDDGQLEVLAGPTAWARDGLTGSGRALWRQPDLGDGYTAVGQFDADPEPEIVLVPAGRVALLEGESGELIWETPFPPGNGTCSLGASLGGPPTIADVDGDGEPEIGIAGAEWYMVFESDGSLKWQAPINDCSSASTGSTVFDFDGDGSAEVIYQDEYLLRIFRGVDGTVLASIPSSSGTIQEMPTIADVDGDGRAEILAGMTVWDGNGLMGLRCYGDANDNWVNARRLWNQHAYQVTNVNDDGTIPPLGTGECQEKSWLTHDSYRLQLPPERSPLGQADLTLSVLDSRLQAAATCGIELVVDVRVGNGGAISAGGSFDVWIYEGDPAAGGRAIQALTLLDLAPGAWRDLSLVTPLRDPATFYLVADDDGTGRSFVSECREDNNSCSLSVAEVPPSPRLPDPVGPALRATAHGDPSAALVTAAFDWAGDAGLPRPAGAHYHVLRGTSPDALTPVAGSHPWPLTTWLDETPAAAALPTCHFLRIAAADACEGVEASP